MVRRHVLAALATGIAAGDEDAARDAIARTEWVLRNAARRRLERSLIDAALVTNELVAADAEATRHVQRVAALELAGVSTDRCDRERVTAAYRKLPAAKMPRVPIATIIAVLAGAVVAAVIAIAIAPALHGAASSPPPAGAYLTGGAPASDAAIEKLLGDDLADLVVAIDDKRTTSGVMAPTEARTPPALLAHPAIAAAWADMVDALFGWLGAPRHGRVFRDASRTLRAKVRAVSDEFAAEGLAYYLQGDVLVGGNAHAVIAAFKVERVAFVMADGEPRRVLSLRRLDKLNLHRTMLGMQSNDLGDPVLLLDQIDHHVATRLLPTLADGAAYPLGDEWQTSSSGRRLAAAAGTAVRREARTALGQDADAAAHIGALVDARDRVVDHWREELDHRKIWMTSTDGLFMPAGLLDRLAQYIPPDQLDAVRAGEDELRQLDAQRIATRAHDLVAATVRRHEAQHAVDAARSKPLRYPDQLASRLSIYDDAFVFRARAELAGYLSQIANDPITPQLSLWSLVRHAFHKDASPEAFAAVVVVEGLARHRGIAPRGPVIHQDHVDLAILAELGTPLAALSGPELRTAANALWNELYDRPITIIVDRE